MDSRFGFLGGKLLNLVVFIFGGETEPGVVRWRFDLEGDLFAGDASLLDAGSVIGKDDVEAAVDRTSELGIECEPVLDRLLRVWQDGFGFGDDRTTGQPLGLEV